MADTIRTQLEADAAAGIQSVSTAGTSVTGMSVQDRIAADKYLAEKSAQARNHLGLTFRQLEPGGTG